MEQQVCLGSGSAGGGARRGQSVPLLSNSLLCMVPLSHLDHLALEASAGTSFHPLGCHQWLGQRQEVGMGAQSKSAHMVGHVTLGSGFTHLLSLSLPICHPGIFIPAKG